MVRTYTVLDIRLGLVRLTEEQQRVIDEQVVPILVRSAERALKQLKAEKAAQRTAPVMRAVAAGQE